MGAPGDTFARGVPYLYAVQMSQSRLLRNFVRWADARHMLKGHHLGIYYLNDPAVAQLMHSTIGAELAALGDPPAVEYTTNNKLGGPEDAPTSIVAERLRHSGRFDDYVGPVMWDIVAEDWECWRQGVPVEESARILHTLGQEDGKSLDGHLPPARSIAWKSISTATERSRADSVSRACLIRSS